MLRPPLAGLKKVWANLARRIFFPATFSSVFFFFFVVFCSEWKKFRPPPTKRRDIPGAPNDYIQVSGGSSMLPIQPQHNKKRNTNTFIVCAYLSLSPASPTWIRMCGWWYLPYNKLFKDTQMYNIHLSVLLLLLYAVCCVSRLLLGLGFQLLFIFITESPIPLNRFRQKCRAF